MARPALVRVGNLRLMAIPATLVRLSPTVFEKSPAVGRDDVADCEHTGALRTRACRVTEYIKNARHVPPSPHAVREMMPALFDHLREDIAPFARFVSERVSAPA